MPVLYCLQKLGFSQEEARMIYEEVGSDNPKDAIKLVDGYRQALDTERADILRQAAIAEGAAPKATEPVAPTANGVPRAYQAMAREEMLRNVLGEDRAPQINEVLSNPYGQITPAKEPNHVNYRYVDGPDDVKAVQARIAEVFKTQIEAQRGTESWAQTQEKAAELLRGRAPGELAGKDLTDLAANAMAQQAMMQRAAFDLAQVASEVRAAGANVPPELAARQAAAIETMAFLHAVDQANAAEIARALNARKAAQNVRGLGAEASELLAKYAANPAELARKIGELGTAEEMAAFSRAASKATTLEKLNEAWKAGLVSGPITQISNILGNAVFMGTRPVVDAVATAVSAFRSGPNRVTAVEPLARVIGNFMGVRDATRVLAASLRATVKEVAGAGAQMGESALTANMSGLKEGWNRLGAAIESDAALNGKTESHRRAIEGTTGALVRIPFTLLGAADSFFRVANERGEAYALATREASREGFNPATREFRDRVAEIAANPTDKMAEQIDAAGTRFTFNSPLGETGRAVQKTLNTAPVLKFFIPFVQTPANVLKEMMRLTPAAPMIKEWRDAIAKGGAERDKAVAEMVVGTAVSGTVVAWALSGNISGQGDPDPNKRRTQMASGWQPYSIKVGDTWYSYQRLQPVGTLIGMAADAATAWEHMTPEEQDKVPKLLATAFANAITNQTFLQGITNIVNALSDPDRFGARFAQNFVSSFVPGALGQTAQMLDPYQREIYSVLDAVKNRIPGLNETLQPKRDPYGQPIAAKERMGEISPITTSTMSQDKVRLEAARLGVGASKAPDHIELPAGRDSKLGKVELTPEQRDIFADKAGKLAHQVLTQMVNSPSWDTMPDMAQRNAMAKAFEVSRLAGKAAAVPPEQIRKEAERIARELQIRLAPK